MTVKVKVYKGKKYEDLLQRVQRENGRIIDKKTNRRFLFLKEYEVKVLIENEKSEKVENEKPEPAKQQTKQAKKKALLEAIRESDDKKNNELNDFYVGQEKNSMKDMKDMMQSLMEKVDGGKQVDEKGFLSSKKESVLLNYFEKLKTHDISDDNAKKIILSVKTKLSPHEYESVHKIEEVLLDELSSVLQTRESFERDDIKTIALIGPTGVGKTTTIGKMAGKLVKEHGKKIGLITTDTYRIAAVEQLETFANILESKIETAKTPKELYDAIDYFKKVNKVDKILIDTVGKSPMFEESIESIKEFMDIAKPDHVSLVLSSTQKNRDMIRILENYKKVNIDSLIFTKLDETLTYGFMIDVLMSTNKGISYVTNGQSVPSDIEKAYSGKLAEQIIKGDL